MTTYADVKEWRKKNKDKVHAQALRRYYKYKEKFLLKIKMKRLENLTENRENEAAEVLMIAQSYC